jgi:hypothetical protein
MSEKKIAIFGVCAIAVLLSVGVTICMVLEHPVPAEVITILATLGGTLLGAPVLGNGVKNGIAKINGSGGTS